MMNSSRNNLETIKNMSISIQDLPTEILVTIFDKLNMINIESCSETCVRDHS